MGQQHRESIFGHKVDHENIGVATRALAELNANHVQAAISLAEQAVENSPRDAGFRKLLGNCYFASGRFASAEQAYRDSLALLPAQPDLVLKLALVEIGQGKNDEAIAALDVVRNAIDPADYGLAVALAGHPDEAVQILQEVARLPNADARVRQNLALAYGLSGDWTMARTVAAQDVPPQQLDSRIQNWMAMATPAHPSDQVAALTGVRPVADPGQPQRLALNSQAEGQALAQAIVPQVQPQAEPAAAEPVPAPEPEPEPELEQPLAAPPSALQPHDVSVSNVDPLAADATADEAVAKATRTLIESPPEAAVAEPVETPAAEPTAALVKAVAPKPAPELPTRFDAKPRTASYVAITDEVRRAAKKANHATRSSGSVIQLGAYSSPERVAVAWQWFTAHFPALSSYTPMRARYDTGRTTVWRLSISGFASDSEARRRCELLQSRGGKCFVRRLAGDSPVEYASR